MLSSLKTLSLLLFLLVRGCLVNGQKTIIDVSGYGILSRSIQFLVVDNIGFDALTFINLNGLKGINVTFRGTVLEYMNSSFKNPIGFTNSALDLYDEKGILIGPDRCSTEYFEDKDINFFSNMANRQLHFFMNSLFIKRPLCPFLFKNAVIAAVLFYDYKIDYFHQNYMPFYEIKNEMNLSMHLNIKVDYFFLMNMHRFNVTQSSTNAKLFAVALVMRMNGVITAIETGYFKIFERLKNINLELANAGQFFQSSNNEWLAHVFDYLRCFSNRSEMIDYVAERPASLSVPLLNFMELNLTESYTFPDVDFCLFKHYPRLKTILTGVVYWDKAYFNQTISLSAIPCTSKFLTQNNDFLVQWYIEHGMKDDPFQAYNESILQECDFDRKLAMCFDSSIQLNLSHYKKVVYYMDVAYVLDWLEYIGPIISFPILSAVAFGLNLLVILIIRSKKNKKEKLFEAKSFRFIEMNSALSCVECFIYQFRLLGICMGANTIFCPMFTKTLGDFNFQIVNHYLSETFKSCSMMSGLLFSIQRFVEASKTKNKILQRFAKIRMRKMLTCVLMYGILISVPVIFSIKLITPNNFYDIPETFYLNDVNLNRPSVHVKSYFYFLHYVSNDFVILVINLAVDGCLVRVVKADMKQKLKNNQSLKSKDENPEPTQTKKLSELEKKNSSIEKKANAMIILSVIIYVFCRLPELVSVFLYYYAVHVFSFLANSTTCESRLICFLVYNLIEHMYMLSYLFNVYLYFKFNTFFNRGAKNYFGIKSNQTSHVQVRVLAKPTSRP